MRKYLNNDYLNPSNGFLTSEQINMIEDNTGWYVGSVSNGESYKLSKYIDINNGTTRSPVNLKIGLLRVGELMSGKFSPAVDGGRGYFTLTNYSSTAIHSVKTDGSIYMPSDYSFSALIKPAMNLKENVVITGGDGTRNNPFTIEVFS